VTCTLKIQLNYFAFLKHDYLYTVCMGFCGESIPSGELWSYQIPLWSTRVSSLNLEPQFISTIQFSKCLDLVITLYTFYDISSASSGEISSIITRETPWRNLILTNISKHSFIHSAKQTFSSQPRLICFICQNYYLHWVPVINQGSSSTRTTARYFWR